MIDLRRIRAELLTRIGAPGPAGIGLCDPTDPRVATDDVVVRLRGSTRSSIFPILEVTLSERLAAVPRLQVIRDLLMPINHALGNAIKHGNGGNSTKAVAVELVLARRGVLVAVTDEGRGFDVGRTFRRFLAREHYFENEGDGFRHLHRAKSTITFENGGRTVLIGWWLPSDELDGEAESFSQFGGGRDLRPTDGTYSHPLLSPEIDPGGDNAWRYFAARARAGEECGVRAVQCRSSGAMHAQPWRILTGRLHATKASATADFRAAQSLHKAAVLKHLRTPPAQRNCNPCLVLYDFHPWMDLWHYLPCWHLTSLQHASQRVGRALAELHASRIAFPVVETDRVENRLAELAEGVGRQLEALPGGVTFAERFELSIRGILQRATSWRRRPLAPIHGALGWDCIYFGIDKHFYLHRFECCQWGDPRLDLGAFAADLLCFTRARYDAETYRNCLEIFLAGYNGEIESSLDRDDLDPYIALAIVQRMQRAGSHAGNRAESLLDALAAVHQTAEDEPCRL